MAQRIPPLNEIVGLPAATSSADIAYASERHFLVLFEQASRGDPDAQRDLVRLRLAYLNWAYASQLRPHLSMRAPTPEAHA